MPAALLVDIAGFVGLSDRLDIVDEVRSCAEGGTVRVAADELFVVLPELSDAAALRLGAEIEKRVRARGLDVNVALLRLTSRARKP